LSYRQGGKVTDSEEQTVTQEDRHLMQRRYPRKKEWTDAEIEMAKALGHL
jgi:hypothetical protein